MTGTARATRVNVHTFPLTRAQRALWIAQERNPQAPLNIAQYVEISGPIDTDAFIEHVSAAVRRDRFMQVRYERSGDEIVGLWDPTLSDAPECVDLRAERDPRAAAEAFMVADVTRPIDPLVDRLMVAHLFDLGRNQFIFYNRAHHLVVDGVSGKNALQSMLEAYTAGVEGRPTVTTRFVDFAAAAEDDARYDDSLRRRRDRAYWLDELSGAAAPPTLSLRQGGLSPNNIRRTDSLPRRTMDLLRRACDGSGHSEAVVIATALVVYMYRFTGRRDLIVGLPVAARTTATLRNTPLPVSNVVPLRVALAADGGTVREVVRRVQKALSGALRHQRHRLEDILDEPSLRSLADSTGQRGLNAPQLNLMLFDRVMRCGAAAGTFRLLTTSPVDDMSVNVYPSAPVDACRTDVTPLVVEIEANPSRYDAAEVGLHHRGLVAALHQVAESLLGERDRTVVELLPGPDFASPPMSEQVPQPNTLPAVLDGAVDAYMDHPALADGIRDLTFGELDGIARGVAEQLIDRGVGVGSAVAILARQSPESVIAWWSVARTGAAILLIDPGQPSARIERILANAGPVVMLVATSRPQDRTDYDGVVQLSLADLLQTRASGAIVVAEPTLDDIAYIVYTSGTTGDPKGVTITHGGLAMLIKSQRKAFGSTSKNSRSERSRIAAVSSPMFDAAHFEILLSVAIGACLVPLSFDDGDSLGRAIRTHRITHLATTPAVLTDLSPAGLPSTVMSVGESLPVSLARSILDQGRRRLLNLYGPAEFSVWATAAEVTVATVANSAENSHATVPIGDVVPDASFRVLDGRLRPVVHGAAGELYLVGRQCARGYLDERQLTSMRFVADPWGSGQRMYRTGDRVRVDPGSGELVYLGRTDHQVSVRGVRIEPAEVEMAASAVSGVRAALVVWSADSDGDVALDLAVTTEEVRDDTALRVLIRDQLAMQLPTAMWPRHVVIVDQMPRSDSGKVDRDELRRLIEEGSAQRDFVPASDPAESMVARVVSDVLGVPTPSMGDHLLELGATSMSAVRLRNALARESHRVVEVGEVLAARDLRDLSLRVQRAPSSNDLDDVGTLSTRITSAQRSMILQAGLFSGVDADTIAVTIHMVGRRQEDVRGALIDVLTRHEILRTVIDAVDGDFRQQVLTVDEAAARILVDRTVDRYEVADPLGDIPIRILITGRDTDVDSSVVDVVAHHIVLDDESVAVLLRDLEAAYGARVSQAPARQRAAAVGYGVAAAAIQLRDRSRDHLWSRIDRDLEFWIRELGDTPSRTSIPSNDPGRLRASSGSNAGSMRAALGQPDLSELLAAARSHRVTAYSWIHAAVAVVVNRFTNSDDVVITIPSAGRDPEADLVVGLWTNPIAIRSKLRPGATFAELVKETSDAVRAGLDHSAAPFSAVVDAVSPARDPFEWPLSDVVLTHRDESVNSGILGPGVAITVHPAKSANIPLKIATAVTDGDLSIEITYRTDRFAAHMVRALVDYLCEVLRATVRTPHQTLRSLGSAARENGDVTGVDDDVVTAIRRVSETAPERVAVLDGDSSMTYGELCRAAGWVVAELYSREIDVSKPVVVLAPRGAEMVVAMVGVMMSGAPYLPVDPGDPPDRIAHLAHDAGASAAVVVASGPTGRLAALDIPIVELPRRVHPTDDASWSRILPRSAAYLIYTSGTSGKPKGVIVSHRSVMTMLDSYRRRYDLTADDVMSCVHSVAFDASVLEIFSALTTGARLVIVDDEVRRDPALLWPTLVDTGVTVTVHTQSAFYALADVAVRSGEPGSIRQVVLGGEALRPPRIEQFIDEFRGRIRVDNLWGATEGTVCATATSVDPRDDRSLIGSPMDHAGIALLDRWLRPVPVGVWADMYQLGPQLARGYHGRCDLTAGFFVAAVGGTPGARMYRTGDIARRCPDGNIEYRGRSDDQVQLRGFRVEPREVAAVLATHPAVTDAVCVTGDPDRAGESALTGWIVPMPTHLESAGSLDLIDDVRAFAAKFLPPHAVPHRIHVVGAWPRTTSGKIDLAALRSVGLSRLAPVGDPGPDFEIVASAVASVVDVSVEDLRPSDRLLDLGVNSVSLMHISLALADRIEKPVRVRDLAEAVDLAAVVDLISSAHGSVNLAGRLDGVTLPEEWIRPQQHEIWLLNRVAPNNAVYHLPTLMHVRRGFTASDVHRALNRLVYRHAPLRTVFEDRDGYPTARELSGAELHSRLQIVDSHSATSIDAADEFVEDYSRRPFDLSRELPWRAAVMSSGDDVSLLVVAHHVAVDAWSAQILLQDFEFVLRSQIDGAAETSTESELPETMSVNVGGAAAPTEDEHRVARQYWRRRLKGAPPYIDLPSPAVRSTDEGDAQPGTYLDRTLPAEVRDALANLTRSLDAHVFHAVHVAWAVTVARFSDCGDVVIGVPSSGRTTSDDLKRVGMFVRTLLLRSTELKKRTLGEAITESVYSTVDSERHSVIGYSGMIAAVEPERLPRRAPYLDVLLSFGDQTVAWEPVDASVRKQVPIRVGHARVPIELTVTDNGGDSDMSVTLTVAHELVDVTAAGSMLDVFIDVVARLGTADPNDPLDLVAFGSEPLRPPKRRTTEPVEPIGAIRSHARSRPAADAVSDGVRSLTYQQMIDAVDRFAVTLADAGFGPGDRLAVLMPPRVEAIVAILAVLSRGIAYVPVDPSNPPARVEQILRLSGALGVITGTDGVEARIAPTATRCRSALLSPGEVEAYVIFTSGSSGQPKGVVVTRSNLSAMIGAALDSVEVDHTDVWTWSHSSAFDFSVWEIFGCLVTGGHLVVVDRETARDPMLFSELISRRQVSVLSQTPSAFSRLTDPLIARSTDARLESLRHIVFGGEELSTASIRRWMRRHPLVVMTNMYGITETTVHLTSTRVDVNDDRSVIGAPLDGVWLAVLDERQRELPVGARGELFVAGDQVSAGYLDEGTDGGRVGAEQSRFRDAPWGYGRMYATGDSVRRLGSNTFEYLGRLDAQVQLRGHRLELDEIAAVLARRPEVADVKVLVRTNGHGDDSVVAFVTSAGSDHERVRLDEKELESLCVQHLPVHAIPSRVIVVDEWPLTGTGKLDRHALLDIVSEPVTVTRAMTSTERVVATAFEALLEAPSVHSGDSNFFALGGTSLSAARLAAVLSSDGGARVSVADIFRSPTVQSLAELLDESRRASATVEYVPLPSIVDYRTEPDDMPLSPEQEDLWLRWRTDPGSTSHVLAASISIPEEVDTRRVVAGVRMLIGRHEMLRTTYPEVRGRPLQHLWSTDLALQMGEVDVLSTKVDDVDSALKVLINPIDIAREMPWRIRLVRDALGQRHLLTVMHHIAVDGASVDVLRREFREALELDIVASPGLWQPSRRRVDYRQYTLWRRHVAALRHDSDVDFWQEVFRTPIDAGSVPGFRLNVTASRTVAGARRIHRSLDEDATTRLTELAAASHTTVFVIVHTALAAVLARSTGHDDVVVGTAMSARTVDQLAGAVGLFAQAIPLRTHIDLERPFRELLECVTARDADAFAHAGLPAVEIATIADPERTAAGRPLFDVVLGQLDLRGEVRDEDFARTLPLYGLDFAVYNDGHRLNLTLTTDERSVDEHRARELVDSVIVLLASAVAAPDRPAADLLVGTDVVFSAPRDEANTDPAPATCGHLLRRALNVDPDALAVIDIRNRVSGFGRSISYRDLAALASHVARRLAARGVGAGDVVVLNMHRSVWSVIGEWGVAFAGAAFVSIEPGEPEARRRSMIDAVGAALLLYNGERPAECAIETMEIDWAKSDPDTERSGELFYERDRVRTVRMDDVAYLVFTSGTTGAPKPVAVTHRGLVGVIGAAVDRAGLSVGVRVMHTYANTFDAHLIGVVPAAVAGSTLVICPHDTVGGHELADLITQESVEVLMTTPGVLATLTPESVGTVSRVVVGGEKLPPRSSSMWSSRVRLVNFYGPSETTIAVTAANVVDSGTGPGREISIGTPVGGVEVLVLDRRLRPVPDYTIGELYVAGPALARGYAGMSAKTAASFVPHPGRSGRRMYRTGDLVYREASGRLVIRGRLDSQIKINGIRLEPGEIDAALSDVSGVRASVTDVHTAHSGDQVLASWVVLDESAAITPHQIRSELRNILPRSIVPSAVTIVEQLPIGRHGKVDRRALPAPSFAGPPSAAPCTPSESLVAQVWSEMLDRPISEITNQSDFFGHGGTSLSATRVAGRLRELSGVDIPVSAVFEHRTLAELAGLLSASLSTIDAPAPVHETYSGPVPLAFPQQRLWIHHRIAPQSSAYHVPVVLHLSGHVDPTRLRRAVERVVERHVSLRMAYPDTAEGPVQEAIEQWTVDFEVVEVDAGSADTEVAKRVTTPFDLARGPAFRASLVRSDAEYVLVIVLHHVAVDGWSMRVLMEDLSEACGDAWDAGEPPLDYLDYSRWLRERLGNPSDPSSRFAYELEHWSRVLEDAPAPIPIADLSPRTGGDQLGGRTTRRLGNALMDSVARLAEAESSTVFHIVHAALAVLLSRLTGRDDVVIGVPTHGRTDSRWDRVVGMFVNTLALRTRIAPASKVVDAVHVARDVNLTAAAHAEVPYDAVAGLVAPARGVAGDPLISVLLVHQDVLPIDQMRAYLDHGSLTGELDTRSIDGVSAKYDLEVVLSRDADGCAHLGVIHSTRVSGARAEAVVGELVTMLAGAEAPQSAFPRGDLEANPANDAVVPDSVHGFPGQPTTAEPPDAQTGRSGAVTTEVMKSAITIADAMAAAVGGARGTVGLDDDFFAIGGTSLSATRMVTILRADGFDVAVRDVFDSATPAELATRLLTRGTVTATATGSAPSSYAVGLEQVPMVPPQRQMWVLSGLYPLVPRWVPLAVAAAGGCSVDDARSAVSSLVSRHHALQMSYPSFTEPRQYHHAHWSADPMLVPESRAMEELAVAMARPARLDNEPPVMVWIVTRESGSAGAQPTVSGVVMLVHHISADGESAAIMRRDLAALLSGAELPAPNVGYAQAARWITELAHRNRPADLEYWRQALDDVPPNSSLERDPSVRPSANGIEWAVIDVDDELSVAVGRTARVHRASRFHVFHAALAMCLSAHLGTDDVLIATPVSLRVHPDIREIVGMFVNTVVLRSRFTTDMTISDLITSIRDRDVAAMDHCTVLFADVIDHLGVERHKDHHPLTRVMFSVVDDSGATVPLRDDLDEMRSSSKEFELQVTVVREGGTWRIRLLFARGLLTEGQIGRFRRRLSRCLEIVAGDPGRAAAAIDVRLDDEIETVEQSVSSEDRLLGDLLDAQIVARPDAPAIDDGRVTLTYRELDRWVSVAARGLIHRGVRPHRCVAIAIGRSIESVVALWAVTRIGGVVIPIDTAYPTERIAEIARVTRAMVITRNDIEGPPRSDAQLQRYEVVRVRTDSLAYVITTSGTTGAPNIVGVTHQGLTGLMDATRFPAVAADRIAMASSPGFDATILDVLWPLISGATSVVVPPEVIGGGEMTTWFREQQVTAFFATPSVLATLSVDDLPDVRTVVVGGEGLPQHLAQRWAGRVRLVNIYGPTETTVCATTAEVSQDRPVRIGVPLPGFGLEILDSHLRPVPPGTVGQLFLSGHSLARGYLGDAALTARRFVAGPNGRRRYATGDLVRWTAEGLEHRGRIDRQIKIRGQRVEPAEVDTVLVRAGAGAAATVVVPSQSGDALVSYVTVNGTDIDAREFKETCARFLPRHMVPAQIVIVPGLPRTSSGKLATNQLPPPPWVRSDRRPRDELETAVLDCFTQVLGVDIGMDDDFFSAGGNSLTLLELRAELAERAGCRVPASALFGASTPSEVASLARGEQGLFGSAAAHVVDISEKFGRRSGQPRPDTESTVLWCVHPASGLARDYLPLAGVLTNEKVLGLQLPDAGSAGIEFEPTIQSVAAAHVEAIRSRQPKGPYQLLGWSIGGAIAHEIASQITDLGEHVSLLCLMDAHTPEELAAVQAPLFGMSPVEPGALTVSELRELDRHRLWITQLIDSLAAHRPSTVVVRNTIFFAADNTIASGWGRYVSGPIRVLQVAAPHSDFGRPDVMRDMGRMLAGAIASGVER
ncbi:putative non-ribosomal peptide synthetase [Gordonia soli NBRC 108243]|uniref:Putative non-ribosomal peptide synthetase n=2 Tax=Gordonia soli TaxID=320799 RepID=M0QM50_9ACTN|nr:putative non-ribosomal peptide synthetase [Gordonia soli NBRC 108243]